MFKYWGKSLCVLKLDICKIDKKNHALSGRRKNGLCIYSQNLTLNFHLFSISKVLISICLNYSKISSTFNDHRDIKVSINQSAGSGRLPVHRISFSICDSKPSIASTFTWLPLLNENILNLNFSPAFHTMFSQDPDHYNKLSEEL